MRFGVVVHSPTSTRGIQEQAKFEMTSYRVLYRNVTMPVSVFSPWAASRLLSLF